MLQVVVFMSRLRWKLPEPIRSEVTFRESRRSTLSEGHRSPGRAKAKRGPRLGRCCRPEAMLLDQTYRDAYELGIAGCEAILADPNVVLHAPVRTAFAPRCK